MGVKKKHVPGCSCCGACNSYSDDFEDASIGGNWSQESGTWSESGGLITTSSDYAELIWSPAAAFTDKFSTYTPLQTPGTGVKYRVRLICSWVDTDNYWFAEGDASLVVSTYVWDVRLGYFSSGIETIVSSDTYNNSFNVLPYLVLCYRDGYIRAIISNSSLSSTLAGIESAQSLPAGDFGLGTGAQTGFSGGQFSNWNLWVDTRGGYDADCGVCLTV